MKRQFSAFFNEKITSNDSLVETWLAAMWRRWGEVVVHSMVWAVEVLVRVTVHVVVGM